MLKGINYPANKGNAIKHAQQNKGEADNADAVLEALNQTPDREYQSRADIEHEIVQVN